MTRRIPSEAEIAVLAALVAEGEDLLARSGEGGHTYTVKLRHLDPQHRFLVIVASEGSLASDALPVSAPVLFEVLFGEWRVRFSCEHPVHVTHLGTPAVQVHFPESLAIERRRAHVRASVSAQAPLKLVAYSGAVPILEGIITDVSRGGLGVRIEFGGESLHPGMVIGGCRIVREGETAATADLEVRHTSSVPRQDGGTAVRAGCRFVALSDTAAKLIEKYVADQADAGPANPASRG